MKKILIFFVILYSYNILSFELFVTVPPQAQIVELLVGKKHNVNTLIQNGQSPHTFELRPSQLTSLLRSKIYFMLGAPFEKQIVSQIKKMETGLILIDTAHGINKRRSKNHSDGHYNDPHIWLSPLLLKVQAQIIYEALVDFDFVNKDFYKSNYLNLIVKLEKLHCDIGDLLKKHKDRVVLVSHPALGYFTDLYGLKQKSLEQDGKSPTPKQIRGIITSAKSDKVQVIFSTSVRGNKSVEIISEAIGVKVVYFNTMNKDILSNLKFMAKTIDDALK